MRRNRRNGQAGLEFGSSGEDSFVAVVVTKLTGALLFILLLTMVIMALLPKAVDLPSPGNSRQESARELTITTPEALPEAIAGRRYTLALAATGEQGPLHWSIAGTLPEGLVLDAETGRIEGTPKKGTTAPADLVVSVADGVTRSARSTRLVVYQSDSPLSTPVWWKPGTPPVPWRAWLEQGFGFLVLWLVHLASMNALSGLERWSRESIDAAQAADDVHQAARRRFTRYRAIVRLASAVATITLAVWLWSRHA